ncbi:MAG: hypothetical protein ACRDPT_17610 [Streptomycetales bacterium]
MTAHLISVGKSLLEFFAAPDEFVDAALAERIADVKPHRMIVNQTGGPEPVDAWLRRCLVDRDPETLDRLGDACEKITPRLWPARVSAELDTFARVPSSRVPMDPADIAVLISSDTADGLIAALWNAVALAHGDLDRILYLSDPEDGLEVEPGNAVVARVRGMDVGDESGFRTAMRGFGVLGGQLARRWEGQEDVPFRCYLSGGFKAAIPCLISLAEGLRSLPGKRPVDAYVLHELTEGPAIKVPLRFLPPEVVREELTRFSDGSSRHPPKDRRLEGYAYEEHKAECCWRLTPHGEGLLALFQAAPEGLLR